MRSPTGRIARREIRFLESEVKMLEHYYKQCEEILVDYESEWHSDFAYFVESFGGNDESPEKKSPDTKASEIPSMTFRNQNKNQENPEDSIDDQRDIPVWARKLFKKIAMIAHPDRIADEDRREALEKVFLRASRAVESGNYEDLISIAIDFDVTSDLDDIALRPILKSQITKAKEKIRKIETEIPWIWGESFGNHEVRCHVLKSLLAQEKIIKGDEELKNIIKEREAQNLATG